MNSKLILLANWSATYLSWIQVVQQKRSLSERRHPLPHIHTFQLPTSSSAFFNSHETSLRFFSQNHHNISCSQKFYYGTYLVPKSLLWAKNTRPISTLSGAITVHRHTWAACSISIFTIALVFTCEAGTTISSTGCPRITVVRVTSCWAHRRLIWRFKRG